MGGLRLVPLARAQRHFWIAIWLPLSLRDTQLGDAAPICPCRPQLRQNHHRKAVECLRERFPHDITEL
jgi:hypothetical protein